MIKNVTIRMDEELLQKVRRRAVDEHMSASRWMVKVLNDAAETENGYKAARQRALHRLDKGFHLGGSSMTREETHAR